MRILLATPAPAHSRKGNRITALRWARLLKELGHQVAVAQEYNRQRCDLLVPLHARRSFSSIERFHRLHPNDRYGEGSGAGLPIVRRAVERMGGEVWLESAPGEGSTFYFSLPEFPTP